MNKFSKGQKVKIVAGSYAGTEAWFDKVSGRPGKAHCFVTFMTPHYSGAQVLISDLVAA